MNCPRCVPRDLAAPYRQSGHRRAGAVLVPEKHEAVDSNSIARCPSCRGVFAENDALVAIENAARRTKKYAPLAGAVRRAYDPPTEAISCPSCAGETTRREWSIGTLVFVDVCLECRGVWLDGGELETLGG